MRKFPVLVIALTFSSYAFTQSVYNFTGAPQYYVVPPSTFSVSVDARGAQGGTAFNLTQVPNIAIGGLGGRVQCVLPVNPGDTLWIYVGGVGVSSSGALTCKLDTGGWNGGGDGYSGFNSFNYNAGGGGGGTDIRLNSQSISARVIVAGGGGGGSCSGCTGGGYNGGPGGDTIGGDGVNSNCLPGCQNGKGGTQNAGGANGQWACNCVTSNAQPGQSFLGGAADGSGCAVTCGSGGGGSSYTSGNATAVVHTQGYQQGTGYVTIGETVTSITETEPFSFGLYPVPAEDILFAGFTKHCGTNGNLKVYDLSGRVLLEQTWNGESKLMIDISSYAKGQYVMALTTELGTSARKFTVR